MIERIERKLRTKHKVMIILNLIFLSFFFFGLFQATLLTTSRFLCTYSTNYFSFQQLQFISDQHFNPNQEQDPRPATDLIGSSWCVCVCLTTIEAKMFLLILRFHPQNALGSEVKVVSLNEMPLFLA